MSIIGSNILAGASGQAGYNLNNSLRFRSSASAYLNRTPASSGNRQVWTWSAWIKRGTLGGASNVLFNCYNTTSPNQTSMEFASDTFGVFSNDSSTVNINLYTTQVFRDPSAWYHFVVVFDTTQATSSNRVKIYVNGNQVTAFSTSTYPSLNYNGHINTTAQHTTFATRTPSGLTDGYLAENNFIDGQALTPSSFGETDTTTGSWKPKAYTSTYGTNGFYLKFADASAATAAAIGKDSSGNGNNWTPSGISVTAGTTYDAMTDVPTNTSATVANYAVMNPLFTYLGRVITYTSANLNVQAGSAAYTSTTGTMAIPNTGKWYFEGTLVSAAGSGNDQAFGISDIRPEIAATYNVGLDNSAYGYISAFINGTASGNYGAMGGSGTVFQIAIDMDNSKVWLGINNSWIASGNPSTGANSFYTPILTTTYYPYFLGYSSGVTAYNFGQRPFIYTPPSGFVALNTYNLPTPTILQGNKYMDATTYSGNSSTQSITNAGLFKPDFVWWKRRDTAAGHGLADSVRGATKSLSSNSTAAEITTTDGFVSFNSNGFGLNGPGSSNYDTNYTGGTYVGWQWQAGQGSTSSNTSGTITSTVSVNTTAGFSIVTYTGNGSNSATVGHGLGVTPAMIIIKARTGGVESWCVWQQKLGASNYFLRLNATDAVYTVNTRITAQSSTTFTLGNPSNTETNGSGSTYVAYCWAEIAGFSKFTSYTGNGSTDGVFVYTGFRPKYVMVKRTNAVRDWVVIDSVRATTNVVEPQLFPNDSAVEDTTVKPADLLSNGFKLRTVDGSWNASGGTYIVMAFAENPFKNANAR